MPDTALTGVPPRDRGLPRPRRASATARRPPAAPAGPGVHALLGLALAAIAVGDAGAGPVLHAGRALLLAATGYAVTAAALRGPGPRARIGLLGPLRRRFSLVLPTLLVTVAAGLAAGYALAGAETGEHLPRDAAAGLAQLADLVHGPGAQGGQDPGPLAHLWLTSLIEQSALLWTAVTAAAFALFRGRARSLALACAAASAALAGAVAALAGRGAGWAGLGAAAAAYACGVAAAAGRRHRAGERRRRPARRARRARDRLARFGPAVALGQVAHATYLLHGVVVWSIRAANPGVHPVALVVVGGGLSWVAALFVHDGMARRLAARRWRPLVAGPVLALVAAGLAAAALGLPGAVRDRGPADRPLVIVAGTGGAAELARALDPGPSGGYVTRAAVAPSPGTRAAVVVLYPGAAVTRDPCAPAFRAAFTAELDRDAAAWQAAAPGVRVLVANLPAAGAGGPARCVGDAVETYTAAHPRTALLDLLSAVCPGGNCPGDPAALRPPRGWFAGQLAAALAR